MSKIGIVTDSSSIIPREIVNEFGIKVAPVGFIKGEKVYLDFKDITMEEFWEMFPSFDKQPSVRAVSPGDFLEAYTELAKTAEGIVCITVSQMMSATFSAANQAAQMVKSEHPGLKIAIIDSKTCVGAQGFIAIESARSARQGKSFEEVATVANDLVARVGYVQAMDNIEYLVRIGRTPKELAQNPQQVKPIVGITRQAGKVENLGKVSSMQEAPAKMVELVRNYVDAAKPVHFLLHYSRNPSECEELEKLVRANFQCAEVLISQYTPTMIAGAGPMLGLAFYS